MDWIYRIASIAYLLLTLTLIFTWDMPWHVMALFFVWLIASILSVTLSKGIYNKWYERLLIAFFLTLLFNIIFGSYVDINHYMFNENVGVWVFAPILCLPAIYFMGNWISVAIERKKQSVHQEKIRKLNASILAKRKELHLIDEQLKKRNRIDSFISLLSSCGAETNGLESHPKVASIIQLSKERGQMIDEIKKLEDALNNLNNSM